MKENCANLLSATLYSIIGSELSLKQDIFDKLEAEFGPHDVDACALADGSNSKLSRYWTNSFRHDWGGKIYMVFRHLIWWGTS